MYIQCTTINLQLIREKKEEVEQLVPQIRSSSNLHEALIKDSNAGVHRTQFKLMFPKKHKPIHKQQRTHQRDCVNSQGEGSGNASSSQKGGFCPNIEDQHSEHHSQQQQVLFPLKFLDIPFREIAALPTQKRQELRKQYPKLAQYIFMSQREKTKFFHQKNLSYRKAMETPGSLPARKIQFRRQFQVKVFNETDSPAEIKNEKVRKYKYDPRIHIN